LLRLFDYITLEVGLGVGALMALAGAVGLIAAVISWQAVGFGNLDPSLTMREVIPAVVLMALGTQTVFASFFISILSIEREMRGTRPGSLSSGRSTVLLENVHCR